MIDISLPGRLDARLNSLADQGLRRVRRTVQSPSEPRMEVDGRAMLAFCSNDYLGLAADARVVRALREGALQYGAGSGASHLVCGHTEAHAQLELRLARFLSPFIPHAEALYFSTGYMANLAVITALMASAPADDTEIFSESLNHASLIDGMRLARTKVSIYRHGDTRQLEEMLVRSTAGTKLVVTDSVFSMDGCLAPLPQLLALSEAHGAWLLVDDAHGFGALGNSGQGALEHFELASENIVYMGTLGKAAGVSGAFVCAHASLVEWLVQCARPYIYTTAAPPALAHALLTSLDIIASPEGAKRREHVQHLIKKLTGELTLKSWRLMPSMTAIQPIVIGDNQMALDVAAQLYERGLWVPAIRPPTVPAGTARLRVTLSAAHETHDVARLVDALNALSASYG